MRDAHKMNCCQWLIWLAANAECVARMDFHFYPPLQGEGRGGAATVTLVLIILSQVG
jgi:hypothetical protein